MSLIVQINKFGLNPYEQQGYINALLKCLGSVKFLKKLMLLLIKRDGKKIIKILAV